MKVIGFAGKYYTLWEVTSSTTDFCNGKHCIIKSYTYLQNISFDKEKVFAMYPNIEIDEELRGRTKSFKSYKETVIQNPYVHHKYFPSTTQYNEHH